MRFHLGSPRCLWLWGLRLWRRLLPAACRRDADAKSTKVSHSDGVTSVDESRQTCDHSFHARDIANTQPREAMGRYMRNVNVSEEEIAALRRR